MTKFEITELIEEVISNLDYDHITALHLAKEIVNKLEEAGSLKTDDK